MKCRFWGVRGSIPTPMSPEQIQAKITAVVQRMTPRDAQTVESKEKFLSSLPSWLYGTTGGNTACTEVTTQEGDCIILDCGSGIRSLSQKECNSKNKKYHFLISHYHHDHLVGLPFFGPAFNPTNELHFYSTFPKAEKLLRNGMAKPYFPIPFSSFTQKVYFHLIKPKVPFFIGNTEIVCEKMRHPGNSYAFKLKEGNKSLVYATDVELVQDDFLQESEFFSNVDVCILDSQYTVEDAMVKAAWGHSSFTYVVDFALMNHIKSLYLFHHEPTYDDKKLHSILQSARWYAEFTDIRSLKSIELAIEGKEIIL